MHTRDARSGRGAAGWARLPAVVALLGVALGRASAGGPATLDRPLPPPVDYRLDSGPLDNPAGSERTLHRAIIEVPGAAWMRLYFGDVKLGPGSHLRIESPADGAVQRLDAAGLAAWAHSSAYFNGDRLLLDLVGGARTNGNRLEVDRIAWDGPAREGATFCGVCEPDDRLPSSVDWAARVLPAGCSAAVIDVDSCLVSAGHCVAADMVVQFRVPASNPDCSIVHPPVEDQFPVRTVYSANGGFGNDWAVMTVAPNPLGHSPYARYGEFRPIAAAPPAAGDPLVAWGYGVDATCTESQTQQSSPGRVSGVTATWFYHDLDTPAGSSGSALVRHGEVVGIATHCPCTNRATRVDAGQFAAARAALCPTSDLRFGRVERFEVLRGEQLAGEVADLRVADERFLSLRSAPSGSRQATTIEIVVDGGGLAVPAELNLRVAGDAVHEAPAVLAIQLFDHDLGRFRTLDVSWAPTFGHWLRTLDAIGDPQSYVGADGRVRVRLHAAFPRTGVPSGFVQRVDLVQVSMLP